MTVLVEFEVPGRPYPLKRSRRNGQRDFDPPENVAAKTLIQILARQQWTDSPYDGPVTVRIVCYYKQKKPTADVDNLAKTVLDALNKVVFKDDRQVMSLTVSKCGSMPVDETVVGVYEVGP